ncbi:HD-GYP domain-containing protein [Tumebacillus permanentifrigoris]|uniref:Putative nucleotidyltransferase with HDIG domain n=1 Tax=Tumebacillus permanentifrigoris TaxID=378543 RepID=A0A316DFB7_9BACL|nr:HD-GYP domain-containing protein [Tumebacillus permanentifrigoris]PWK15889.1 putative nucleotidyltransferase with HDIG domain [Tumebacillus permanentifrigoris]
MSSAKIFNIWCLMLTLAIAMIGLYEVVYRNFPYFLLIEGALLISMLLMLWLPKRYPRVALHVMFWNQLLLNLGLYYVVHDFPLCAAVLFFLPIYTLLFPNRRYFFWGQLLTSIGYLVCSWDKPVQQHVVFYCLFLSYTALLSFVSQFIVRNASEVAKFQERVEVFSRAIEARDSYTQGHSRRVSRYAVEIGKHLPGVDLELLRVAGDLHDIGKISTPDAVLLKPGRLTDEEYTIIKRHPVDGANLLRHFGIEGPILDGVLYHHERLNGTGYPEGRAGNDIPVYARILAVADTFDAMTTTRSYRHAFPPQTAYDEILSLTGDFYDAVVVDSFVRCYERILAIYEEEEREHQPHAQASV